MLVFQEKGKILGLVNAVKRHNIWVAKFFEGTSFTLEIFERARVIHAFGMQDFHCQCNITIQSQAR